MSVVAEKEFQVLRFTCERMWLHMVGRWHRHVREAAMNEIRVVVKNPGEPAEIRTIPNTLKAMQECVGGYIDLFLKGRFEFYCNENGKAEGLKPNVLLEQSGVIDVVVGPVLVSNTDEDGEQISLSGGDAAEVVEILNRARAVISGGTTR